MAEPQVKTRVPTAMNFCRRFRAIVLFVIPLSAWAQIGDRPEEGPQVALPAVRKMTPEPALTPQEELRTFQLPPGFRIELVAAEPLVHDPVAAAYDLNGDLWVVEMN